MQDLILLFLGWIFVAWFSGYSGIGIVTLIIGLVLAFVVFKLFIFMRRLLLEKRTKQEAQQEAQFKESQKLKDEVTNERLKNIELQKTLELKEKELERMTVNNETLIAQNKHLETQRDEFKENLTTLKNTSEQNTASFQADKMGQKIKTSTKFPEEIIKKGKLDTGNWKMKELSEFILNNEIKLEYFEKNQEFSVQTAVDFFFQIS